MAIGAETKGEERSRFMIKILTDIESKQAAVLLQHYKLLIRIKF